MNERIERFLENFGKAPDEPPPAMIPQRWRTPVFVAMILIGTVGLTLFLWLVAIPAVQSQSSAPLKAPLSSTSGASKPTSAGSP